MRIERKRIRALGAAAALVIVAQTALTTGQSQTLASWSDAEHASGSFAAGTVDPPQGLSCGPTGLLQPVRYNWSHPAGGLERTGYRWTASGPGGSPSGNLGPSATSVTLAQGLLGLGIGTFTLRAVGEGGWESEPVTGSYSVLGLLGLTALSSCSIP